MTFDLRTLADGAANAWDDAPEFLKPILRDCSDALTEAANEIDRLTRERDEARDAARRFWSHLLPSEHGTYYPWLDEPGRERVICRMCNGLGKIGYGTGLPLSPCPACAGKARRG